MHRRLKFLLDPAAPEGGGGNPAPQTHNFMSDSLIAEVSGLAEPMGHGGAPASSPAAPAAPPEAPSPAAAPSAPAAPAAPKSDDIVDRMTPRAPQKPAAPAAPAKPTDDEPKTPADLRKAYLETKAKLAELEKATPKSVDVEKDPRWVQLTQEAKALKEEHQRLKDEFSQVEWTRSDEFNERYRIPAETAWKNAVETLRFAQITDEATGQKRAVTPQELQAIVRLDDEARADKIMELFGASATRVGPKIEQAAEAFKALQAGYEEANTRSTQLLEERNQRVAQATQQAIKAFDENVSSIMKGNPDLYSELPDSDPDASEHNSSMRDAKMLADFAFKPPVGSDPKKVLAAKAALVARSIGFEKVSFLNSKLQRELDEVKTKLAQYEKSEPGIGGGGNPAPGGANTSWEDDIRGLAG